MQRQYVPKGLMVSRILGQCSKDIAGGYYADLDEPKADYLRGLRGALEELPLKELIETYDAMIGFQPR